MLIAMASCCDCLHCEQGCQSPSRLDGHRLFSPLSPPPMITLTDASMNGRSAHEEILYSEDFDAIQEYLMNSSSPMVSLSPSFFRQNSGSTASTIPVAGPFASDSEASFQLPKSLHGHVVGKSPLCNENGVQQQTPNNVASSKVFTSLVNFSVISKVFVS